MIFAFADSHAYVGCRVTLQEQEILKEVLAAFADGTVAAAECWPEGKGIRLAVARYTTRKGTRIDAKLWLLRPGVKSGEWRVAGRLTL